MSASYRPVSTDYDYLRRLYCEAKNTLGYNAGDLDLIFAVASRNPELFPSIINPEGNDASYLTKWVREYIKAADTLPSNRLASPKTSCTDPILREIVKNARNMSDASVGVGEQHHNLFMSAENIQGNLLEEFVAINIRQYGFIWCRGSVLRAIDFCTSDGTLLLQIKNKSNSENSSSNKIRIGTTIKKWYRLGTKTKDGKKYPDFKWDTLNELINTYKTEGNNLANCSLSEDMYKEFIPDVTSKNKRIITDS